MVMIETGSRGSPDVWLDAAYEVLIQSGVDAVRILPLAKNLKLSRASFYWFFKDRDELLEGLLDRWRNKNTGSLIRQSEAYADTIVEGMLNVTDCWFRKEMFDPKLEFAIRSWALQSPTLQEELQAADNLRIDAIKQMLMRFGMPLQTADVRARAVYLIQIGYISLHTKEDMAIRMKRIPEYVAMYTGVYPEQRELDRFYSRIGFDTDSMKVL
ncbi:TetR/AcrR family transcriptional regulator [Pseudogulbenkiania sp. MAI-1]|uniref:TetR/AcrR family transcriptional regulator n=1 Tax=Pseudogulbenkiania sp. MAI-1 TaxID=990370 RepID=UPI00045EBD00|nr:TetR/AcrR family transcriptional regulator [Pseudogulbenkiania sp. MAI-1]